MLVGSRCTTGWCLWRYKVTQRDLSVDPSARSAVVCRRSCCQSLEKRPLSPDTRRFRNQFKDNVLLRVLLLKTASGCQMFAFIRRALRWNSLPELLSDEKEENPLGTPYSCCCCFFAKQTPAAAEPPVTVKSEEATKSSRMKVKFSHLALVFFLLLSMVMTGCFFWQYRLPKLQPGELPSSPTRSFGNLNASNVAWG